MSNTELVKEAVKSAEEDLRNEEKQKIKDVVKAILEQLSNKEEKKHVIEDEIKVLRKDLEDLKEGRIDRIKERQEVDPKAKSISIIIIKEKIIERPVPTWFYPWIIEIKRDTPWIPYYQAAYPGTTTTDIGQLTTATSSFTTNNSAVHMYTSGTYKLQDGTVKYL